MTQKFRRDYLQELTSLIDIILGSTKVYDDFDKLHMSVLADMRIRFQKKLIEVKENYQVKLTPTEAFALKILYKEYYEQPTTFVGNGLHQLSLQVDRQYS